MREQRNDPKRLRDILQAIDTIFQYVGGCDMQAFVTDKETTRWRRFMQRLNNSLLQGAAVRISPTILNISNRELFNMLQSHISK